MADKKDDSKKDFSQTAHDVFLESIGEKPKSDPPKKKNKAAQSLGRKGGKARARSLSKRKRSEIAKKAAAARWAKNKTKK